MRPFDLFDIERDLSDFVLNVEIVQLVGIVERFPREHGDHVERHLIAPQFSDAIHHPKLRPVALARFSIAVVKKRRSVNADADVDLMPLKEIAPRVVDQNAIGLEGMSNLHAAGIMCVGNFNRAFVVRDRQHHRLARMPYHGEALLHDSAREDELKDAIQGRVGHPALRIAVRKVAVRAIEIAEWSRLQDK